MSRINKVNPGQYTQAGRLTADDTARELKKQRETGSPKPAGGSQLGLPAAAAKAGEKVTPHVTQKDPPSPPESAAAPARRATAEDKRK